MTADGPEKNSLPCAITINTPFPTHRLAAIALRALSVDQELSPLVRRSFSLARNPASKKPPDPPLQPSGSPQNGIGMRDKAGEMKVSPRTGGALHLGPDLAGSLQNQEAIHSQRGHDMDADVEGVVDSSRDHGIQQEDGDEETILVTQYSATTNRMLRVSVNGFFESISVVINCMKELDVDAVSHKWVGEGEAEVDELQRVQGLQEVGIINR